MKTYVSSGVWPCIGDVIDIGWSRTLYEAYDQDDVAMEDCAGVTLDDFCRVEITFETNVCVYKLVELLDAENGKTTAELVRRSLCHYPDTLHLNLYPKCTHVLSLLSMSKVW